MKPIFISFPASMDQGGSRERPLMYSLQRCWLIEEASSSAPFLETKTASSTMFAISGGSKKRAVVAHLCATI